VMTQWTRILVSIILKQLSWLGFDIISFGYDHTPISETCPILAPPFFTVGLFLYGIINYITHNYTITLTILHTDIQ